MPATFRAEDGQVFEALVVGDVGSKSGMCRICTLALAGVHQANATPRYAANLCGRPPKSAVSRRIETALWFTVSSLSESPLHLTASQEEPELAKEGDRAAVDQLFAPCIPRLRQVTARVISNPEICEDALQEGLLLAFRHLEQFEGRAQFAAWLHAVVVNAARSRLRRTRSSPPLRSIDKPIDGHKDICIADTLFDPRPGADLEYERGERIVAVSRLLDRLPARWRVVIRLYDMEGLSMREVAVRLSTTVGQYRPPRPVTIGRISSSLDCSITEKARGTKERN